MERKIEAEESNRGRERERGGEREGDGWRWGGKFRKEQGQTGREKDIETHIPLCSLSSLAPAAGGVGVGSGLQLPWLLLIGGHAAGRAIFRGGLSRRSLHWSGHLHSVSSLNRE